MDLYTLALSIAYTNKAMNEAEVERFKVQVEITRDILETVGEEKTFYFLPKIVSKPQNGYDEYIYVNDSWELMGSTDVDLSGYMTLAPINPTAEEIAAMPDGQPYRVSNSREAYVVLKGEGGGIFRNSNYNEKTFLPHGKYASQININQDTYTVTSPIVQPLLGELLLDAANTPYLCVMSSRSSAIYSRLEQTSYKHKTVSANPSDYFYPSEKCMVDYVEAKIGSIGTALDTLNDNLAEV